MSATASTSKPPAEAETLLLHLKRKPLEVVKKRQRSTGEADDGRTEQHQKKHQQQQAMPRIPQGILTDFILPYSHRSTCNRFACMGRIGYDAVEKFEELPWRDDNFKLGRLVAHYGFHRDGITSVASNMRTGKNGYIATCVDRGDGMIDIADDASNFQLNIFNCWSGHRRGFCMLRGSIYDITHIMFSPISPNILVTDGEGSDLWIYNIEQGIGGNIDGYPAYHRLVTLGDCPSFTFADNGMLVTWLYDNISIFSKNAYDTITCLKRWDCDPIWHRRLSVISTESGNIYIACLHSKYHGTIWTLKENELLSPTSSDEKRTPPWKHQPFSFGHRLQEEDVVTNRQIEENNIVNANMRSIKTVHSMELHTCSPTSPCLLLVATFHDTRSRTEEFEIQIYSCPSGNLLRTLNMGNEYARKGIHQAPYRVSQSKDGDKIAIAICDDSRNSGDGDEDEAYDEEDSHSIINYDEVHVIEISTGKTSVLSISSKFDIVKITSLEFADSKGHQLILGVEESDRTNAIGTEETGRDDIDGTRVSFIVSNVTMEKRMTLVF